MAGGFRIGEGGRSGRGAPPSRGAPARRVPGPERGRAALSPASRPALPRAQLVTRAPISWWILLKRPRSPHRTKAIVSLPPAAPQSFPESPFLDRGPWAASAPRGAHRKSPTVRGPSPPEAQPKGGGREMNQACWSWGHAVRFPKGVLRLGAARWASRAPPPHAF